MAIENIKTPKSLILPSADKIEDNAVKGVSEKLMSAIDTTHKKLYEDIKTLHRILAGLDAMQNALDMGSNLINNVTDPADDQDAATKKYIDDLIAAIDESLWEIDGTETQLKTADEIDMQSKKIINLLAGAATLDAVNYTQLGTKANAGANNDITSLTGLTTPLGVAYGGIGAISFVAALLATAKQLSYTGNGNDNRNLTGAGFNPNSARVQKSSGTGRSVIFKSFSSDGADYATDATGIVTTNTIQDFITDGIQVGTRVEVNSNGEVYDALLLLTSTGAATG